jgi:REP element-mobilizing transposase RayT
MTTNIPLLPGQYYHIYNRGNNSSTIFFEERTYRHFLKLYAHHIQPVAETFAYCLLRNHFHFLVRIRTDEERHHQIGAVLETAPISEQTGAVSKTAPVSKTVLKPPHRHFNNMFIAYTKAINKAYQRTGSLLEKPYRRKLVESDSYFTQLVTYIHQNPQKHGFVDDFRDWPWSSYHTLTTIHQTHLKRDFVLAWFGGIDNFIKTHQTEINEAGIELLIQDDWF